jgi:predicted O-linked N-acetylglucosamine transferase (SPINDLY family)
MSNTQSNGLTPNWQQTANIALTRANTEKTKGQTLLLEVNQNQAAANAEMARQLAATQQALKESQELVLDWQSAMEAWKDLAQVLRDEIKACPNHEAHGFGKDQSARNQHRNRKEDEARISKKLVPVFSPLQKGLIPA